MSNSTKRGKLVVISGPSGTGKTSICNALLERLPGAMWSVSATTRPPRTGEVSGLAYEFIDRQEFERRVENDEFLEHAEYVGHLYGTPREPVERALREGRHVVMEIDVQGGIQIATRLPESVCVFIMPPNMESLRARLEGRNTEAREVLKKRLAEADGEIATARDSGCYQHFVVNDDLEDTIQRVMDIVLSED